MSVILVKQITITKDDAGLKNECLMQFVFSINA